MDGRINIGDLATELGVDRATVTTAASAYATRHGLERTYADYQGGLPYCDLTADAAAAVRDQVRQFGESDVRDLPLAMDPLRIKDVRRILGWCTAVDREWGLNDWDRALRSRLTQALDDAARQHLDSNATAADFDY